MKIHVLDSEYWEHIDTEGVDREFVERTLSKVALEAAGHLPDALKYTNIMVEPTVAERVIPEIGVTGITYDNTHVSVVFDYKVPYGKDALAESLRTTAYHELVHAVTYVQDPWQPGVLFGAVTEGLATVFERDTAGSDPLWGKYESDEVMKDWYAELKQLPDTTEKDMRYFVNHPDGRKWIVYKTGTWMIDRLLASGAAMNELMSMSYKDVVKKFDGLSK